MFHFCKDFFNALVKNIVLITRILKSITRISVICPPVGCLVKISVIKYLYHNIINIIEHQEFKYCT